MKKQLLNLFLCIAVAISVTEIRSQPPGPPKPPSPEERIKFVSEKIEKEITLTTTQKEKIKMAYKNFFKNMEEIRNKQKHNGSAPPPPPPPPIKKEDMDRIATQRDEMIKGALSAAQYKKYQEIELTLRPKRPM